MRNRLSNNGYLKNKICNYSEQSVGLPLKNGAVVTKFSSSDAMNLNNAFLVPKLRLGMPFMTLCVIPLKESDCYFASCPYLSSIRRGASRKAFPNGVWEREIFHNIL